MMDKDVFDIEDYQQWCAARHRSRWIEPALGLVTEAGEAAEVIRKAMQGDGCEDLSYDDRARLVGELGDVMHYLLVLCDRLDMPVDRLCMVNMFKLRFRDVMRRVE